jgi:hypothetical protein
MRRVLQNLALVLLIAGAAAAVDITLRDGTVITVESYRLTGSYIMLKLVDGGQVAYDVADVDVELLRAAEAEAKAAENETVAEEDAGTISAGRSLKHASAVGEDEGAGLKISDRDVKHIRGSGVLGDDEEAEDSGAASSGGVPEGFQQGGGVVLNSLRVTPAGEGRWTVEGEIINRTPNPVINVRVQLETAAAAGGEPWRGEVAVTSFLGPEEKGVFNHGFAAEAPPGRAHPDVRASVIWMQQETRRVPDYTRAGGVSHPSNLPLERGGVSGADLRPTPIE